MCPNSACIYLEIVYNGLTNPIPCSNSNPHPNL